MTEVEIAECKKYAESKGFVIFHYEDELAKEDMIYMDNNGLICSARSDEVETVDEFKTLLDNSLIYKVGQMHLKWLELEKEIKEKKYKMKLNRIKGDF